MPTTPINQDAEQIARDEIDRQLFCKKITYNADKPKDVLARFRTGYYPRIAVTVDMIATGIDVKPLECLIFMRDVKLFSNRLVAGSIPAGIT